MKDVLFILSSSYCGILDVIIEAQIKNVTGCFICMFLGGMVVNEFNILLSYVVCWGRGQEIGKNKI